MVQRDRSFSLTFSTNDACDWDAWSTPRFSIRVRTRFCNDDVCFQVGPGSNDYYELWYADDAPFSVSSGSTHDVGSLVFTNESEGEKTTERAANQYASIVDAIATVHNEEGIPFRQGTYGGLQVRYPSIWADGRATDYDLIDLDNRGWPGGGKAMHEYGHRADALGSGTTRATTTHPSSGAPPGGVPLHRHEGRLGQLHPALRQRQVLQAQLRRQPRLPEPHQRAQRASVPRQPPPHALRLGRRPRRSARRRDRCRRCLHRHAVVALAQPGRDRRDHLCLRRQRPRRSRPRNVRHGRYYLEVRKSEDEVGSTAHDQYVWWIASLLENNDIGRPDVPDTEDLRAYDYGVALTVAVDDSGVDAAGDGVRVVTLGVEVDNSHPFIEAEGGRIQVSNRTANQLLTCMTSPRSVPATTSPTPSTPRSRWWAATHLHPHPRHDAGP